MALALLAELLGVHPLWAIVGPLAAVAGWVGYRHRCHQHGRRVRLHVSSAIRRGPTASRDERAWLALDVPTSPFLDHERTPT